VDDYLFGVCICGTYRICRCKCNRQKSRAKEAVPPERKGNFLNILFIQDFSAFYFYFLIFLIATLAKLFLKFSVFKQKHQNQKFIFFINLKKKKKQQKK